MTATAPERRWEEELRAAARNFDWAGLADVAGAFVRYLRRSPDEVSPDQARAVLGLLRENRRYDELLRVTDALLGRGVADALVRRQLAQALVDRDTPATSLLVFRTILEDAGTPVLERAEALGGTGRCHKQLYVLDATPQRRAQHLPLALGAYRAAYEEDRRRYWHGINVVALLALAERDGVEVPGTADPGGEARALATDVLAEVTAQPEPDAWALATACEACVAMGRDDDALGWADRFVAAPGADAFKIASALRQLMEVWRLDTDRPPGSGLLPLLRSALLRREGGTVTLPTHDVRDQRLERAAVSPLERVLGAERFRSLTWYRTGLERCRAVARIETPSEDGVGTGFLVEGPTLHPALPPFVLVTNGHVVPEAIEAGDAVVVFRGLDDDGGAPRQRFRVVRHWWYEPSARPGLDTSLLELDGRPQRVTPLPLAPRLPRLGTPAPPRAYVIGHPRGLAQPQFTMQDNVLLDHDGTWVHYRSPTEKGSSGSPVFDDEWRLIALHHAGALDTPRLHGDGGSYAANEGIALSAIRAALQERAPVAEDVAG